MNRDDRITLVVMLVLAMLLCLRASVVLATGSQPQLPPGISCSDVRAKVAEHGRVMAYAWARLQGYSRREIAEARKCLK